MASQKMSLKLLVDKKGKRVLFAEAPKEFVDFLFHIISLPFGSVIEFIGSKQMVGCFGKLKDSVDGFNETYLQPDIKKDDLFCKPKIVFKENEFLLPSSDFDTSVQSNTIYWCPGERTIRVDNNSKCRKNASLYEKSNCPTCGRFMRKANSVVPKAVEEALAAKKKSLCGGYVKEVVSYMVMDDLMVKPLSAISSIALINSFGFKDLNQLEEIIVSFGEDEALKLLKASLSTNKVLTTMYMHKNDS